MVSYVKTSLTQTPENLKEAIDWIRKIEQDNGINELANALKEVLDENVAKANKTTENISDWDFTDPRAFLVNLSLSSDPFEYNSEGHISQDDIYKVRDWAYSLGYGDLQRLISDVANGLKSFDTGIMQTIPQSSAYFYTVKLSDLEANDKNMCANILLAILPVVYGTLSYLYWRCTPSTRSSSRSTSWQNDNTTSDNGLRRYLMALGYSEKNLKSQKGSNIVSLLNGAFKAELSNANAASKQYYDAVLGMLQQTALASLSSNYSSNSPLTSLYLLSYRYLTYPLDDNSTADNTLLGLVGAVGLVGGAYGFDVGGFGTAVDRLLGFN
ncbi:variant erythrocyte surface antigen-1 family protein [Babesia caballi]|uniref:Variant erythrocyte surface antigen-1 family protein n=1 Tax=Babesia caballi TaxID=5871 RepID=A0AAV4LWN5_BABCB|nr:variant erythrocyte surface antigen-1 family protein [Babesia caballi]